MRLKHKLYELSEFWGKDQGGKSAPEMGLSIHRKVFAIFRIREKSILPIKINPVEPFTNE
jgi:hypothetical protein